MDYDHDRRRGVGRSTLTEAPSGTSPHAIGKQTLVEALGSPYVAADAAPTAVSAEVSPPPISSTSGPRPTLQMLFGVPGSTAGAREPDRVHAAASRGAATPTSKLPFADQIQHAFGRHDVSAIQAHTGSGAADSAREIGARAYAVGDHVVLGAGADLHTVAHEAAHVVQQRGGVQLKDGIGATGDRYETHADAVADLVVAGKSAEALLDEHAPAAAGGGRGAAVQMVIVSDSASGQEIDTDKVLEDEGPQGLVALAVKFHAHRNITGLVAIQAEHGEQLLKQGYDISDGGLTMMAEPVHRPELGGQNDPPKRREDPPKRREDPPKRREDPPKRREDPPKPRNDKREVKNNNDEPDKNERKPGWGKGEKGEKPEKPEKKRPEAEHKASSSDESSESDNERADDEEWLAQLQGLSGKDFKPHMKRGELLSGGSAESTEHNGEKSVHVVEGHEDYVVAVKHKSMPDSVTMEQECKDLQFLASRDVPVVKVIVLGFWGKESCAAMVMERCRTTSKRIATAKSCSLPKTEETAQASLFSDASHQLTEIKSTFKKEGIVVGDLQFLITHDGHFVVNDPNGVWAAKGGKHKPARDAPGRSKGSKNAEVKNNANVFLNLQDALASLKQPLRDRPAEEHDSESSEASDSSDSEVEAVELDAATEKVIAETLGPLEKGGKKPRSQGMAELRTKYGEKLLKAFFAKPSNQKAYSQCHELL